MRFREFYDRVTEGMALSDLWADFKADTRSSYTFYSRDVDWSLLKDVPPWKRFFRIAGALFWAMLMHLTPARRVILLLSLLFVVVGIPSVRWQSQAGPGKGWQVSADTSTFVLYGALGLLFLLALELADRVVMKRDLQIAREIQRWLVPSVPPVVPGLDIAFATRPANTVGGDFYDVIVRRVPGQEAAGSVLLVVADVAGKSVPAALLMATFQASLHALTADADSLTDLVQRMNRSACARSMGGQRFTTAFFAELDLASRHLVYVNAGHNYPYLRRRQGSIEQLITGGLPLGIQEDAAYSQGDLDLDPGDLLLVYTDGLVEAVNDQEEEFSEDRLRAMVETAGSETAATVSAAIRQSVDHFVGQARQYDDMTWMVIRTGA